MPLLTRITNSISGSHQPVDNSSKNRFPYGTHNEHPRSAPLSKDARQIIPEQSGHVTAPKFQCPCCEKPLITQSLGGIRVDVCFDCGGIWIGQGKMPMLIRRGTDSLNPLKQQMGLPVGNISLLSENLPHLLCPQCEAPMEGGPYSYNLNARVDVCPLCNGSWVGAGELAMIISHYYEKRTSIRPSQAVPIG